MGKTRGVPDSYPTGDASTGRGTSAANTLASDNAAFGSEVDAQQATWPAGGRGRGISQEEAAGARLTVSPSMKIPDNAGVPTQYMGNTVPSKPGRSAATFFMGADEVNSH